METVKQNGRVISLSLSSVIVILCAIAGAMAFYFVNHSALASEVMVNSATIRSQEKQLDRMEKKIDKVDTKVELLADRMTKFDDKIDRIGNRIDRLNDKLDAILIKRSGK